MTNNKNVKNITILAVLYMGLLTFLFLTNPNKLAVGWLILPFILLFSALFITILLILRTSQLSSRVRRPLILTALLAGVPTLILLLDSVNQLSLKDVLIIAVLGVLALFYFSKLSVK